MTSDKNVNKNYGDSDELEEGEIVDDDEEEIMVSASLPKQVKFQHSSHPKVFGNFRKAVGSYADELQAFSSLRPKSWNSKGSFNVGHSIPEKRLHVASSKADKIRNQSRHRMSNKSNDKKKNTTKVTSKSEASPLRRPVQKQHQNKAKSIIAANKTCQKPSKVEPKSTKQTKKEVEVLDCSLLELDENLKSKIVPGSLGEMLLQKARQRLKNEVLGPLKDEVKSAVINDTKPLVEQEPSPKEEKKSREDEDELMLRYQALQSAVKGCESNYVIKTNILNILKESNLDVDGAHDFIKQLDRLLKDSSECSTLNKENSNILNTDIKFPLNTGNDVKKNSQVIDVDMEISSDDDILFCGQKQQDSNVQKANSVPDFSLLNSGLPSNNMVPSAPLSPLSCENSQFNQNSKCTSTSPLVCSPIASEIKSSVLWSPSFPSLECNSMPTNFPVEEKYDRGLETASIEIDDFSYCPDSQIQENDSIVQISMNEKKRDLPIGSSNPLLENKIEAVISNENEDESKFSLGFNKFESNQICPSNDVEDEDILRAKLLSEMNLKLNALKSLPSNSAQIALTQTSAAAPSKTIKKSSSAELHPSKPHSLRTVLPKRKNVILPINQSSTQQLHRFSKRPKPWPEKKSLSRLSSKRSNLLDIGGQCLDTKNSFLDAPSSKNQEFSLSKFPPVKPVIIPIGPDSDDSDEECFQSTSKDSKDNILSTGIDEFIRSVRTADDYRTDGVLSTPKVVTHLSKEKQEEYRELKRLMKIKEEALKMTACDSGTQRSSRGPNRRSISSRSVRNSSNNLNPFMASRDSLTEAGEDSVKVESPSGFDPDQMNELTSDSNPHSELTDNEQNCSNILSNDVHLKKSGSDNENGDNLSDVESVDERTSSASDQEVSSEDSSSSSSSDEDSEKELPLDEIVLRNRLLEKRQHLLRIQEKRFVLPSQNEPLLATSVSQANKEQDTSVPISVDVKTESCDWSNMAESSNNESRPQSSLSCEGSRENDLKQLNDLGLSLIHQTDITDSSKSELINDKTGDNDTNNLVTPEEASIICLPQEAPLKNQETSQHHDQRMDIENTPVSPVLPPEAVNIKAEPSEIHSPKLPSDNDQAVLPRLGILGRGASETEESSSKTDITKEIQVELHKRDLVKKMLISRISELLEDGRKEEEECEEMFSRLTKLIAVAESLLKLRKTKSTSIASNVAKVSLLLEKLDKETLTMTRLESLAKQVTSKDKASIVSSVQNGRVGDTLKKSLIQKNLALKSVLQKHKQEELVFEGVLSCFANSTRIKNRIPSGTQPLKTLSVPEAKVWSSPGLSRISNLKGRSTIPRKKFKVDHRASNSSLSLGPRIAANLPASKVALDRSDGDLGVLCPFDLLGRCNDDACGYRHFASVDQVSHNSGGRSETEREDALPGAPKRLWKESGGQVAGAAPESSSKQTPGLVTAETRIPVAAVDKTSADNAVVGSSKSSITADVENRKVDLSFRENIHDLGSNTSIVQTNNQNFTNVPCCSQDTPKPANADPLFGHRSNQPMKAITPSSRKRSRNRHRARSKLKRFLARRLKRTGNTASAVSGTTVVPKQFPIQSLCSAMTPNERRKRPIGRSDPPNANDRSHSAGQAFVEQPIRTLRPITRSQSTNPSPSDQTPKLTAES